MYILDTNVLLDNHKNLLLFDDDVLMPITVIKELDKHKKDQGDVGYHARHSIKLIDDAIENNNKLSNGINIIIDSSEYEYINQNDDKIIEACLGRDCIFVTNDLACKIKAQTKNIKTIKYQDTGIKTPGKTETIFVNSNIIDMINSESNIDERLIECNDCGQNASYILKDEYTSQSVLATRKGNKIHKINAPKNIYGCIKPKNAEQRFYANMLLDPDIKVVIATGKNGSGKSLLAMASGLQIVNSNCKTSRMLCCKSIYEVGNSIGFLPGVESEKLQPHYASFKNSLDYIASKLNRSDYYEKGFSEVEYKHIGYMRGVTYINSYILADEIQNEKSTSVKTILSRAGINSKVVLCGDLEQIDNKENSKYDNGLYYTQKKLYNHPQVGIISLEKTERSEIAEIANLL